MARTYSWPVLWLRIYTTHLPRLTTLSVPLVQGQGVPFKQYLTGSKIYSCSYCRCHAADSADVESKVLLPPAARILSSGACCGAGYSRC